MKIIDTIREYVRRQQEAGYDPREQRRQIGEEVAIHFANLGYKIEGIQFDNTGPLGGEATTIKMLSTHETGRQRFTLAVYAHGVFSPDNVRVRALLEVD